MTMVLEHGVRLTLVATGMQGMEANIFKIPGRPESLAKVYRNRPSKNHAEKLMAMLAARHEFSHIGAWPETLLTDLQGTVIGYTMPLIDGTSIYSMLDPTCRKRDYAKESYGYLVSVATALAGHVARIHALNSIACDLNPNNIRITSTSPRRVASIDCDSMQLELAGRLFTSNLAPPDEWAFPSIDINRRSVHEDNFTLAYLIHQLLFVGNPPFGGRGTALDPPELKVKGLYYHGPRAQAKGIRPPFHCPPAWSVSPAILDLFCAAFEGVKTPPSAAEWGAALGRFQASLASCPADSRHQFSSQAPGCPWCSHSYEVFAPLPRTPVRHPARLNPKPAQGTSIRVPGLVPTVWQRTAGACILVAVLWGGSAGLSSLWTWWRTPSHPRLASAQALRTSPQHGPVQASRPAAPIPMGLGAVGAVEAGGDVSHPQPAEEPDPTGISGTVEEESHAPSVEAPRSVSVPDQPPALSQRTPAGLAQEDTQDRLTRSQEIANTDLLREVRELKLKIHRIDVQMARLSSMGPYAQIELREPSGQVRVVPPQVVLSQYRAARALAVDRLESLRPRAQGLRELFDRVEENSGMNAFSRRVGSTP